VKLGLDGDCPDLTAYVAERDSRFGNADLMKAWRTCAEHAVQGLISHEVLEPVPDFG
jgi:hypothetical protein